MRIAEVVLLINVAVYLCLGQSKCLFISSFHRRIAEVVLLINVAVYLCLGQSKCLFISSFHRRIAEVVLLIIEPRHDKTNKMSVRPTKPSLIRVFAVRMKKPWVLSYPLSAQWRLWSDWAHVQADPSLRWAHCHFVGSDMSWLICCYVSMFGTEYVLCYHSVIFQVFNASFQMPTCVPGVLDRHTSLKIYTLPVFFLNRKNTKRLGSFLTIYEGWSLIISSPEPKAHKVSL